MATKTKAPKVAAVAVDADGFAIIDPKAIKPAYDPKAPRPWKLHCSTCQKPVWRASRAPDTCYACDRTAAKPAKVTPAQTAKANKLEGATAGGILNVATGELTPVGKPKPSKSQNPRVAANKMVMDRAKAIADRRAR